MNIVSNTNKAQISNPCVVRKIILDDNGTGQGVVPYLPLNELNKNKGNN